MHHPLAVGVIQGGGHLAGDTERLVEGELALHVEPLPERAALHVRHHVEEEPAGLSRVIDREDMRVGEPGRHLDLPEEPLGADLDGDLRAKDLESDSTVVAEVPGEEDDRHAALAQLALDAVAIGECSRQTEGGFGHPTKLRRRATWQQVPRSATVGRMARAMPCSTVGPSPSAMSA